MRVLLARLLPVVAFVGVAAVLATQVDSQEQSPAVGPAPTPAADQTPQVPKGVEVMARGPVHEAYASPQVEAKPTQPVAKKPPAPLEEMAPEERPDGDVVWIAGYWAYDDDRKDFLWVSGCWRVKPENKEWVPGYWREVSDQWQWVPGFWAAAAATAPAGGAAAAPQSVTYYPTPPAPPNVAPPGPPAQVDLFFVPGYWQWNGVAYVWRAGHWSRVRPGYVYIAPHYAWTPTGYVFVPGYWDYAVARRGVIYTPIVVDYGVVPATYVYTPSYAVADVLVLDAMFVNPYYAHYYFGDYYGPVYTNRGYVTTVVYSRTYYEPVVVYQRWEYRDNPRWFDVQVNLVFSRNAGQSPLPPRTLVEQQTIINNINNTTIVNNNVNNTKVNNYFTSINYNKPVLAPAKTLMAAKGIQTTRLDPATRTQIRQASQAVQVAAATERRKSELAPIPPGQQGKPRTASMAVPTVPVASRVGPSGVTHAAPNTAKPASSNALGTPSHPNGSGTQSGTTKQPGTTGPMQSGTAHPMQPGTITQPPPKSNPPRTFPPLKKNDEKKKDR
jgi:hypothetical protein